MSITMDQAVQTVHEPNRATCVQCHASLQSERTCDRCHQDNREVDFKKIAHKGTDFSYMASKGRDVSHLVGRDWTNRRQAKAGQIAPVAAFVLQPFQKINGRRRARKCKDLDLPASQHCRNSLTPLP